MKQRIIVVDDEQDIVNIVAFNLKKEGYEISTALNGEEAMEKIKKETFHLIILDLMLPGIQGIELCHILKSTELTAHIPIIMLTAKSEEIDKVLGLEMGADDYITKPFSPRELMARVKSVLRRVKSAPLSSAVLNIGDLEINKESYLIKKKGKELKLSAMEFRLLVYLIERRGKIVTRDTLLDNVWKDEAYVELRTVDVHIRRLRAQIEDDSSNPVYIKTRRGIGYYFEKDI